jgi:hypothetical protein
VPGIHAFLADLSQQGVDARDSALRGGPGMTKVWGCIHVIAWTTVASINQLPL